MIRVWALVCCVALLAAGHPAAAEERALVLATGPVAGNYYPVGGALCRVINQGRAEHGLRCLVESTSGSEENLRRLGAGDFDLALVQSDWQYYAPRRQEAAEQGSADEDGVFRAVLSLQSQPLTLLAGPDSGIAKLADLDGKRVNLAPEGSGLRAASLALLEAMGWSDDDFEVAAEPLGPALVQALCDGRVDAVLLPLSHPSALVAAAIARCQARLVGLEAPVIELIEGAWPFYGRADIPGGLYPGHPEPLPSVGLRATLVAPAALPPDLVYRLVADLFGRMEGLKAAHPLLGALEPADMVGRGNTLGFHDGALRYYEAQGWPLPARDGE